MAADACEVLDKDLGCPEVTDQLPGWAGSARRQLRKARTEADAEAPVSSQGQSHGAHEEAGTWLGSCEQDPAEPELSMPEPAPLGGDKRAAEKKRVEKVAAKGSTAGPPVPKSLPVQRKVEPPSLDPAEEPLLWEGLTLNKCILVASIVALLSVTFQVLQAPCSREAVSRGRQDPPAPPLHEVVIAKEKEVVQEVVTAQPAQPASSTLQDGDDDDDDEDDSDDDRVADSNLAEPWIFKKWFGRSAPEDEDEDEDEEAVDKEPVDEEAEDEKPGDEEPTDEEPTAKEPTDEEPAGEEPAEKESEDEEPEEEEPEDEDEEPTDVPEAPPVAREVKKSREKVKVEKKVERKVERVRERRAAQAERSGRRQAAAKDKMQRDRAGRAPRAPREPEPQKKRGRERRESRRERAEPRREAGKGRPGRAEAGRESSKRDWRQQKGSRKPWEPAASLGKDPARPREGKRRD